MVSCLLIDKNPAERRFVSAMLRDLGFHCVEREGAEDGIRFCQESDPQLVMMDASAGPDTSEFLRLSRPRGRGKGRPVIILYAEQPDLGHMGNAILDGASEFLIKPFDRALLQFKLLQAGIAAH